MAILMSLSIVNYFDEFQRDSANSTIQYACLISIHKVLIPVKRKAFISDLIHISFGFPW